MIKLLELEIEIAGEKIPTRTHIGPHFDEILGIVLTKLLGDKEFLDRCVPNRILEIGVGGGPFDEHPDEKEKEGECAATLVARALGVEDEPVLESLLTYTRFNDTGKPRDPKNRKAVEQHHPFEPGNLVKRLHERFPEDPERVIRLVEETIIEPIFLDQWKFFNRTKPEFEKATRLEKIRGSGDKQLILAVVFSDSEQVQRYAISKFGAKAGVVIQRKSSGQTQIFTNKKLKLDLDDTAKIIRVEEQLRKGRLVTTDWDELESEGVVSEAEEWYYFRQARMLLNGSLSHPEMPPTKLTLEGIRTYVKIGLNPETFEPSRAGLCRTGRCTSTKKFLCSWRKWGLKRCRKIRWEKNQQNKNG